MHCYTTYLKYYENWQSCPILNRQNFIQGIYILNTCAINFKQMHYKYIESPYFFSMCKAMIPVTAILLLTADSYVKQTAFILFFSPRNLEKFLQIPHLPLAR